MRRWQEDTHELGDTCTLLQLVDLHLLRTPAGGKDGERIVRRDDSMLRQKKG